jgi:hypothetical protein
MKQRPLEKQIVAPIVKKILSFWKLNIFNPVYLSPIIVAIFSTVV